MDALEKTGAFSGVLPAIRSARRSRHDPIGTAGVLHAGGAARGRNTARDV